MPSPLNRPPLAINCTTVLPPVCLLVLIIELLGATIKVFRLEGLLEFPLEKLIKVITHLVTQRVVPSRTLCGDRNMANRDRLSKFIFCHRKAF